MESLPERTRTPGDGPSGNRPLRVGLLSDTHGLLRPEALAFLRGSDRIIHAGDICDPAILDALRAIAPVTAVRGNCDQEPWARALPGSASLQVGGLLIHVLHDLGQLEFEPRGRGVRVVVSGHSHKPGVVERDGVLFVNPGNCGPRRFRLPVAVGELVINAGRVSARTEEIV